MNSRMQKLFSYYKPYLHWGIHSRMKKLFSYYKPYLRLLFADMACALVVSATALLLPLCANHITKNILAGHAANTLERIYGTGAVMLGLLLVHVACNMFVDYQGHMMGAMMERDMRSELFEHYQKLSFGFYDEQKTGQLMTRLTNDSLRDTNRHRMAAGRERIRIGELYYGNPPNAPQGAALDVSVSAADEPPSDS